MGEESRRKKTRRNRRYPRKNWSNDKEENFLISIQIIRLLAKKYPKGPSLSGKAPLDQRKTD